jgi:Uma2 family endonuclease
MASNPVPKLTEEEYLAIERAAEFRSEFVDGEMFAMAGASTSHLRLQQNLAGELYACFRGNRCEAFGSDCRIRVSGQAYVYADVAVACGPVMAGDQTDNLTNPVAIFEVLSPSTEKYDRGLKFQLYRTIDSLKDYVLVNQEQVRIEQFTRRPDGTWTLHDYQGSDAELKIDSIGVAIPLRRIYDRVSIPQATN